MHSSAAKRRLLRFWRVLVSMRARRMFGRSRRQLSARHQHRWKTRNRNTTMHRDLVKTGDISQERFTEIEKVYQSRQAALDAARDEARTLMANVQALKAEVKLAQKRLNDATVRAPFDGAVQEKLVSAGEYLKENTPILTLVKTNPVRLRVDLPESAAGTVHVGTNLTFTTDAAPGDTFTRGRARVESFA